MHASTTIAAHPSLLSSCPSKGVDPFFAGRAGSCIKKSPYDIDEFLLREELRTITYEVRQLLDLAKGAILGSDKEKCAADSILRYFSDNNETRAIFEKDKASLIQAKTFGLFGNNTIEHRFSSVLGNHLFCRLSSKNYLVRLDGFESFERVPTGAGLFTWVTIGFSTLFEFVKENHVWKIKNTTGECSCGL